MSRAIHATQLELVAVKEIPSHDEASVRAVVAELKLLRKNAAKLEAVHGACRNVVALYGAYYDRRKGVVCLVMEYVWWWWCGGGEGRGGFTHR